MSPPNLLAGTLLLGMILGAVAPALTAQDAAPGEQPAPARAIPSPEERAAAVQRACDLLLANQEAYESDKPVGRLSSEDDLAKWQTQEAKRLAVLRGEAGSEAREWPYEGVYRVEPGGLIPAGYRVGGTAIVCEALMAAPGFDESRREAVLRAADFMLDLLENDPTMAGQRQSGYDVRAWGHIYGLSFLVQALKGGLFTHDGKRAERVQGALPKLVAALVASEISGGGWNYSGSRSGASPFMTAAALLALFQARAAGVTVDEGLLARALDALESGRADQVAYAYSGPLQDEREPLAGATARAALAELALMLGYRSDAERLTLAVDAFLDETHWQALKARKSQQGTHEAPYGIAPYYFFFGHHGAALAIEHLPQSERPARRERLHELLWRTREARGGWNDRIFPRTESYSTAMAVLALIAPDRPSLPPGPMPEGGVPAPRRRGGGG